MSALIPIHQVAGRPIPLRGNDIDTDRIIPARYLKAITFDGIGQFAFYDVRFDAEGRSLGHVLDDPRYQAKGPRVAIVNKNFGCGSSREHAPQALLRWGIKAIIGESFGDIFFGNCVAIGLPCVQADEAVVAALLRAVEDDPAHTFTVDLDAMTAAYRGQSHRIGLPEAVRQQFLDGTWDATRTLLAAAAEVRSTAAHLPYIKRFAR